MSVRVPAVAALAAAALALTVTPASAVISFDPTTGTGSVGKGDVQTALGWTNKQLQDGAASLRFTTAYQYSSTTTWECTAADGTTVVRSNGGGGSGVIVYGYEVRGGSKVTGFVLTGRVADLGSSASGGPPTDSCLEGYVLTGPAGPPVVVDVAGPLQIGIAPG